MAKMTLVVLAAGMGTRFGERIKQLEPLGPEGELLIDYSVYDAIRAGFDRVLFIIRKDIEQLFKATIGARVEKRIQTDYVFQSPDQIPCRSGDFPGRTKPWGTAQALYCCRDALHEPFAIVNADDFYGRDAFMRLGEFLKNFTADACSVGFLLKNTLSDYGTVNRGVCMTDNDGLLTQVEETKRIGKDPDGVISGDYNGEKRILCEDDTVSMSMWGFGADFMPRLTRQLAAFLEKLPADEQKAELTIADAVDAEIHQNGFRVRNIATDSRWFGITYEADTVSARETLRNSVDAGVYTSPLWK
ncbi:MAG: sugar phosphate nucleotidyltransferase [Oscillospiraceae bacterium]